MYNGVYHVKNTMRTLQIYMVDNVSKIDPLGIYIHISNVLEKTLVFRIMKMRVDFIWNFGHLDNTIHLRVHTLLLLWYVVKPKLGHVPFSHRGQWKGFHAFLSFWPSIWFSIIYLFYFLHFVAFEGNYLFPFGSKLVHSIIEYYMIAFLVPNSGPR